MDGNNDMGHELEMKKLRHRINQLEKQLKIEKNVMTKILDELPISIFFEDKEGRALFTNKQACIDNGLSREEIIGKTVFEYFPEHVAQKIREEDLKIWETKELVTKQEIAGYKGVPTPVFTGKTIIEFDEEGQQELLLGFALNISKRVEAERLLQQKEKKFRHIVNHGLDCFLLFDERGQIKEVNKASFTKLGYSEDELLQLTIYDIFPNLPERLTHFIEQETSYRLEHTMKRKNKKIFPVDTNFGIVQLDETKHFFALCRDITERKAAEQQIEHMAYHDALTSLPNRWFIHDKIEEIVTGRQDVESVALLLLDLDHFKVINDSLGHHKGDILLQQVSERLMKFIQKDYTLARFGGDEFLLLIPSGEEEAIALSEKIIEEMEKPFFIGGKSFTITPSIGISISPEHGEDFTSLIRNADIAMYESKAQGRNGYQIFNPQLKKYATERMNLEVELRQALLNDEFILYYQPKVNLKTGEFYGMEALIRWQHKEKGLVYPGAFIEVAEETGIIVDIGEWVLREACRQCKSWHDEGLTHLSVSINISAVQFQKQDLESLISEVLEETGLSPEAIQLELTESTVMKQPIEAANTLRNLKKLGISISIDDFGTGFSSLSYLKHFPIDTLKIDRTFITYSDSDEANAAIAIAVITLAHSLNLNVVAEGVENKAQLEFLKSGECDCVQGFYISYPLEKDAATALLKTTKRLETI
ncbi:sensor domain-containing protein [Alkalihalobacterium bogoriense]|uniref:sensor domain-containing protein n=1 Tax=Alkalihalobacterium bogoriense TaxID=246272 RepID=UPI00068525A0|nr:bifunctional diguanylate cyclase/phosphodiesterase [Alkalihalobacterium bogoriense]